MYKKIIACLIISLYFLVFFVALEQGPLVSLQSFLLGLLGLFVIFSVVSDIAKRIMMVDISDQDRKQHKGTIPLVGGIGLYISLVFGSIVFGVGSFFYTLN